MKKRVTGLGGVFVKSLDPEAIKLWYQKYLDIQSGEHGALFHWRHSDNPEKEGASSWSPFPEDPDCNKVELWEPRDENKL